MGDNGNVISQPTSASVKLSGIVKIRKYKRLQKGTTLLKRDEHLNNKGEGQNPTTYLHNQITL
jgi:hypothetical protein